MSESVEQQLDEAAARVEAGESVDAVALDMARRTPGHASTPCDHVTLRSPRQPCPHPECWTRGPRLMMWRDPVTPAQYTDTVPPMSVLVHDELYERRMLRLDGVEFWGWRKV